MKIRKDKCLWCLKRFDRKEWIARKGVLKGQTIVTCYCSKKCGDLMNTMLQTASMLEDLEDIRKKMRKGRKDINLEESEVK